MNAAELRQKSEQELRDELLALRREQFNLRMQRGVNPDAVRNDQITQVRKNIAPPVFDVTLTFTHADFERLLGNRHVREHTDPDLAATLDMARHGTARGLYLARGNAASLDGLEAVFTEADLAAGSRQAAVATLELLAKLCSFRL